MIKRNEIKFLWSEYGMNVYIGWYVVFVIDVYSMLLWFFFR